MINCALKNTNSREIQTDMLNLGDKLPAFDLLGVDGKRHNQFEYADRYAVVVVFTCNHCPQSLAYWPRLIHLLEKFEADNLGIIAINPNDAAQAPDDSYDNMLKLAKHHNLVERNFRYLHDESQELAQKFGAQRTPEAFLFNSKRELVYKGAIDDCWENANMVTRIWLEDAIESALDGIEVDFPEIPAVGCSIKWKK